MSLKREIISGVFFTSIGKYSNIIVTLIVSAILSRLLTASEFGVVSIATVIITFFNIFGDIGIGPAIIQRNNLSKSNISDIHTLCIYIGLILSITFFLSSYIIARIYSDYQLIPICQWLSLDILLNCASIVPLNLEYKKKHFKTVAYVSIISRTVAGAAAILFALNGGGAYALVLSSISGSFLICMIYNCRALIGLHFRINRESIDKILSFSTYQFLFNLINYFSRNIDKLLIGRYIGMSQLGYYDKSYRLMMLPVQNISFVITPVLLPTFSSIQNDKGLVAIKFLKLLGNISFLAFPISAALFFCAEDLIILIFGNQWEPSITPFKILSFTVSLQMLTSLCGSIYQVIDETKKLFISGCWGAFFIVSAFIISILGWKSLNAICIGYLIAQILNTSQTFYLLFDALECPLINLLHTLYRPLLLGVILFCIIFLSSNLLPACSIIIDLLLKIIILLAGIVLGIIIIWHRNPLKFVKDSMFSILKNS